MSFTRSVRSRYCRADSAASPVRAWRLSTIALNESASPRISSPPWIVIRNPGWPAVMVRVPSSSLTRGADNALLSR
jgi:hypothetical protein